MLDNLRIFISSRLRKTAVLHRTARFLYRSMLLVQNSLVGLAAGVPLSWLPTPFARQVYLKAFSAGQYEKAKSIADGLLCRPLDRVTLHELAPIYGQMGDLAQAMDLWTRAETDKKQEPGFQEYQAANLRAFSPRFFCAFGHVAHMELYLRGQAVGLLPQKDNVFVGSPDLTSGKALLAAYEGYLRLDPTPSAPTMGLANRFGECLPLVEMADGTLQMYNKVGPQVERLWYQQHTSAAFQLPDRYGELRDAFMRQRGLDPQRFWVVFHVRSAGDPSRSLRDATLENYHDAMRLVIERGGYVVRMGDPSMPKLTLGDQVIDLAHATDRTPELDIAFMAAARFAVCVNSGPAYIPGMFDVPALATNWPNLSNIPWFRKYRLLPRHARYISTGEELSLQARLSHEVGMIESHLDAQAKDIRFEENSAIEILAAVRDMFDLADQGEITPQQVQGQKILQDHGCYPLLLDRGFLAQVPDFVVAAQ